MDFDDRCGMGVLSDMRARSGIILSLFAASFAGTSAQALETDQFYAWGKPIGDSTEYLNAWVRLEIQSALDSNSGLAAKDCESAVRQLQKSLQKSIYQPIELWIISSDLVDKIPKGLEANREYRASYLLSKTYRFDTARGLQPSPTLQVNEIRFGSDKLAHLFSEGWWYYKYWRKYREDQTEDELQRNLFNFGVKLEKSIQGTKLTGVFSPGDLEANVQGLEFYKNLCHGEEPLLSRQDGRWIFSDQFDIGGYVHPKWDESWNPNYYTRKRWEGVQKTMAGYCPLLESDWVIRQRNRYTELDTMTVTAKLIRELVDAGELPDPMRYDITSVCK